MAAGTGEVTQELYINNSTTPIATYSFPVSAEANPSKMVIGQERDAVNHPGKESFRGQIARLLIYEKPLSDEQLEKTLALLIKKYQLGE